MFSHVDFQVKSRVDQVGVKVLYSSVKTAQGQDLYRVHPQPSYTMFFFLGFPVSILAPS